MIVKMLTVAPFGTNCYILGCESSKESIIIDPGGEPERILGVIEEQELSLKYMIGTHVHFDHIAAAEAIQEKRGIPLLIHPEEMKFLESDAFAELMNSFGFRNTRPPINIDLIDTNQTCSFGRYQFETLETPGHSPGGVSLLFENEVFVGDTLFAGSIGRTDFPGSSMQVLMNSIKTKLMSLDDNITVYPGHIHPTTIGQEREYNPFRDYWN